MTVVYNFHRLKPLIFVWNIDWQVLLSVSNLIDDLQEDLQIYSVWILFLWTKYTLNDLLVWPKACLEGVGNEITLPTKNRKDLTTIYS